jgi:hypothetical protein
VRDVWLFKNPDAPAVKREAEEDWGQGALAMTACRAMARNSRSPARVEV